MNIKEINGPSFKKLLAASKCRFRYHNKAKRGGNFGFEMHGLLGGRNLELWGHYSPDGELYHLAVGEIFGRSHDIEKEHYKDIKSLINLLFSICCDVKEA